MNPDIRTLNKYPILNQAKEFIKNKKPDITKERVETAYRRIERAIKKIDVELGVEPEEELISFGLAKMILMYFSNKYLLKSFSIYEAKNMKKRLETDEQNIKKICEQFSINYYVNKNYYLEITQYCEFSPNDKHYTLSRRNIGKGYVELSRQSFLRIIENIIQENIEKGVSITKQKPPQQISWIFPRLYSLLPKTKSKKISTGLAPCMKKMLEQLEAGENLSHTARWILTAYLKDIGYTEQEIIEKFKNSPDFNEKITTYHVQNIMRKYSTPSCEKIRMYGLCVDNCNCKNPRRYGMYARKYKKNH